MTKKNPHAVALGRRGGRKKSDAKTLAARANILKRWTKVRAEREQAAREDRHEG